MPEKKRQHYVPRFILRQFSISKQGKQINLYNLNDNKFVENASLKEQASLNYFYGKDGKIEDTFGTIETEAAKVVQDIYSLKLPTFNSSSHSTLLFFILTLGARTLYKAEEQADLLKNFMKKIASLDPRLKDHLDEFEIKVENPLGYSLKAVATSLPLATDLRYKLIVNKTKIPFLISDNPVVYYNNFLEGRKKIGSNIGIAVKGLQIFMPISPIHQIIFYDQNVYKINGARKSIFEINNDADILNLNGLQFLNANINIFYNEQYLSENVVEILKYYEKYRRTRKINLSEYTEVNSNKDIPNVLIQSFAEDLRCNLNLSFIKILKKANAYELGNNLVHLRNENLVRVHREFTDLVDQKKYKPTGFNEFLKDKFKSRS